MTRNKAKRITMKVLRKRQRRIRVYKDPHFPTATFLLGFRGDMFLEPPHPSQINCPYIPFIP